MDSIASTAQRGPIWMRACEAARVCRTVAEARTTPAMIAASRASWVADRRSGSRARAAMNETAPWAETTGLTRAWVRVFSSLSTTRKRRLGRRCRAVDHSQRDRRLTPLGPAAYSIVGVGARRGYREGGGAWLGRETGRA